MNGISITWHLSVSVFVKVGQGSQWFWCNYSHYGQFSVDFLNGTAISYQAAK